MNNFALASDFDRELNLAFERLETVTQFAMPPQRVSDLTASIINNVFAKLPLPARAANAARRLNDESLAIVRALGETTTDQQGPWPAVQAAHVRRRAAQLELDALLRKSTDRVATPADCAQYTMAFGDTPSLRPDIAAAADAGDYDSLFEMVRNEYAGIVQQKRAEMQPAAAVGVVQRPEAERTVVLEPSKKEKRFEPFLSGGGGAHATATVAAAASAGVVPAVVVTADAAQSAPPPATAIVVMSGGKPEEQIGAVTLWNPLNWPAAVAAWFRSFFESASVGVDAAFIKISRLTQSEQDTLRALRVERAAVIDMRLAALRQRDTTVEVRLALVQEFLRTDMELARRDEQARATTLSSSTSVRSQFEGFISRAASIGDERSRIEVLDLYVVELVRARNVLDRANAGQLGAPASSLATPELTRRFEALRSALGDGTQIKRVRGAVVLVNSAARTVPLNETTIDERTSEATLGGDVTVTIFGSLVVHRAITPDTAFVDYTDIPPGGVYVRDAGGNWTLEFPLELPPASDTIYDQPGTVWRAGFRSDIPPFEVTAFWANPGVPEDEKVLRLVLLAEYVEGVGILALDAVDGTTRLNPLLGAQVAQTFLDRVNDALARQRLPSLDTIVVELAVSAETSTGTTPTGVMRRRDLPATLPPRTSTAYRNAQRAIAVIIEQMHSVGLQAEYRSAGLFGQQTQEYRLQAITTGQPVISPGELFKLTIATTMAPGGVRVPVEPAFRGIDLQRAVAFWTDSVGRQARALTGAALEHVVEPTLDAHRALLNTTTRANGTLTRARLIPGDATGIPALAGRLLYIDFVAIDEQGNPKLALERKLIGYGTAGQIGVHASATLVAPLCASLRVNRPECNTWSVVSTMQNVNWTTTNMAMLSDHSRNTLAVVSIVNERGEPIELLRQTLSSGGAGDVAQNRAAVIAALTSAAVGFSTQTDLEPAGEFFRRIGQQDLSTSLLPTAIVNPVANLGEILSQGITLNRSDVGLFQGYAAAIATLETLSIYVDLAAKTSGVALVAARPTWATRLADIGKALRKNFLYGIVERFKSVSTSYLVAAGPSVRNALAAALKQFQEALIAGSRSREEALRALVGAVVVIVTATVAATTLRPEAFLTLAGALAALRATSRPWAHALAAAFELLVAATWLAGAVGVGIGYLVGSFALGSTTGSANLLSGLVGFVLNSMTIVLLWHTLPAISTHMSTFVLAYAVSVTTRLLWQKVARHMSAVVTEKLRYSATSQTRSQAIANALILGGSVATTALAPYLINSLLVPVSFQRQTLSPLSTLGDFVRVPQPSSATTHLTGDDRAIELAVLGASAFGRLTAQASYGVAQVLYHLIVDHSGVSGDQHAATIVVTRNAFDKNAMLELRAREMRERLAQHFVRKEITQGPFFEPIDPALANPSVRNSLLSERHVWEIITQLVLAPTDEGELGAKIDLPPQAQQVATNILAFLKIKKNLDELDKISSGLKEVITTKGKVNQNRIVQLAERMMLGDAEFSSAAILAAMGGDDDNVDLGVLAVEIVILYEEKFRRYAYQD